jgi:SNF2 family DNA or RNA helicase
MVLNDIGTGKTLSALWAADYLMNAGLVHKCLVLSPLSTIDRVWADGIFHSFPNRTFATLHGTAEKRRRLMKLDHDFYIVNHDGFRIIEPLITDEFDLIIVDEAAVYRNAKSQRFKQFYKFTDNSPPSRRFWLMTGTPTPNAPTDAYALGKILGNPQVPRLFSTFRDRVMFKVGQWKWMPKPNAMHYAHQILHPSVRFKRDDCVDLPPTVIQRRTAELSTAQKAAYKDMQSELVIDLGKDGYIDAANEAVKLQKLVQICAGAVYNSKRDTFAIDCTSRVSAVKQIIEETNEKVIVFVSLSGALKMLATELEKDYTVAVVEGAVSSNKRSLIFQDFQHAKDPRILVAHPGTMAHGLTLTAASTVVWFIPPTSNEIYTQANGRIERIGKRFSSNVVHISGTKLEDMMYSRLENKQKMQGVLLDLLQTGGSL